MGAGTFPYWVTVNPVTNKIYVANINSSTVTVIDGETNSNAATVNTGGTPYWIGINPATNRVYVANQAGNNVTVIIEQSTQTIPLNASITPLANNTTTSATPSFTVSGTSTFSPNAPAVQDVRYQVDTWQGAWSGGGAASFTAATAALQSGLHILYAYAVDSQAATSTQAGSPLIGNIAAYVFLVKLPVPAITSLSPANAIVGSSAFMLTVNGNNFTTASTILWNGSARSTAFVNATQLTASITAADIATTGTAQVSVYDTYAGLSAASSFAINNPVPSIATLAPTFAAAGGSAFTLTVNGNNFVSGSTVQWNGSSRITTFASPTQLTAAILAGDLSSPGTASVTVSSPSPGGGVSSSASFTVATFPAWVQLSPAGTAPAPRYSHSAVWDPTSKNMIVFGGSGPPPSQPFFGDVWYLSNANGIGVSQWTAVTPSGTGPSARAGHTAVYDASNDRMIVFGGAVISGSTVWFNDTWVLSNAAGSGGTPTWNQLSPTGAAPAVRNEHTAVYDAANNRMMVFGGNNAGAYSSDVWVLTNANGLGGVPAWIQLNPAGTLTRENHAAAYDPATNRMIVFGGDDPTGIKNEIWILTNANGLGGSPAWMQVVTDGSLPVPRRCPCGGVYDSNTNRFTIMGGALSGFSTPGADTWVLSNANGTGNAAWTQLSNFAGPARAYYSSTFDSATNRITVFGGETYNGSSYSDFNDVYILDNANGAFNPTPAISTISPSSALVGGPAFTLTVNGSNFVAPSVVQWNGSARATTFVNSTQLNAAISASDIATVGTEYVAVVNPGPVGGASSTATFAVMAPVPDLTITKTHTGSFAQGQSGATYTITASNIGTAATSGTVTVTDTLPSGLTATAITGTGWSCTLATLTCTRSDALTAGAGYPPLTLTVNVSGSAAASVINTATVSGGGELNTANDTASDPTSILDVSSVSLAHTPNPAVFGAAVTLTATVTPSAATGKVTFYDGTTVLGVATLSSGQATMTTVLLASGSRSLKAHYGGDGTYAGSSSAAVAQTVNAKPANSFQAAVNYNAGTGPAGVAVGDFNGDGKPDLAVANNGGNNVSVLLSNGNETFQAAVNYDVGVGPISVAVGDFNGDGKVDLAVANVGSNNVSVLLGNGDGTFQAAVNYIVGTNPLSVAVADFNGDGKADLVFAVFPNAYVTVLLGNGDGTFQAPVNNSSVGNPYFVAVGDFNGDGKADVAVANRSNNNVVVLLGNGDGTFTYSATYSAGAQPYSIAAGDVNGDGKADLVVANLASNNVSVFLGNGDGTFQAAINYTVGTQPLFVAVGDFNGDGNADLAVSNKGSNSVSVLLGNGDGTFQPAVNYGTLLFPEVVVVGDFNGDGLSDLAVANYGSNSVSILLGTAIQDLTISATHTGNFQQSQTGASYTLTASNVGLVATTGTVTVTDTLPAGLTATAIAGTGWSCTLATLTCTRSDALAASASYPAITVTVNVAGNAAASVTNMTTVSGGGELNTANDTASDVTTVIATPDLTVSETHSGNFSQGQTGATYTIIASNVGNAATTGTVTLTDTLPAGLTATAMGGTGWSCTLGTLTCTRSGGLAAGASYPAITLTVNVASNAASVTNTATVSGGGEVNTSNDTASDPTIITGSQMATLALTRSPNPSVFGQPVTLTATVTSSVATGKVTFYDGTSVLGVATLSGGQATLTTVLLPSGNRSLKAYYTGDATYAASTSATVAQTVVAKPASSFAGTNYNAGARPWCLAVGDFNGDGKADLAVANYDGNTVSVLLGNGDGTFQTAVNYSAGTTPIAVAVGDFNGDGKADLAVANANSNNVSVLLGNGDGTFQAAVNYNVGSNPYFVAVGDFNGDGKADLVVTNRVSNNVSVLLGNGDGTFRTAVNYNVNAGTAPAWVAVGDFNGDGKADLAVTSDNGGNNGYVSVLLGNGDGTFQAAVSYGVGSSPIGVAVADFNGDGQADLAVTNYTGINVSVLLGNGDGTFQAAVNYPCGDGGACNSVAVGDFNGDGKADLIVGEDVDPGFVGVLLGNGNGTFQASAGYRINGERDTFFAVVGEFNGDGRTDFAVANQLSANVSVYLGAALAVPDLIAGKTHTGNFTQGQTGATYSITVSNIGTAATSGTVTVTDTLPAGLTAAAISGTGWSCTLSPLACTRADALAASASYPAVTVTVNVSSAAAASLTNTATVSGGNSFTPTFTASDTTTILQTTTLTLTRSPNPSTFGQAVTLTATVSPAAATGKVTFYDGTAVLGSGTVSAGVATLITRLLPSGSHTLKAYYGGDATDAVSTSAAVAQTVNTAPQNSFQAAVNYSVGTTPYSVAIGDFNGDGKPDLVVANRNSDNISVLLGNGNGTFQAAVSYPTTNPFAVVVGDFNGDGKADLVVSNYSSNTVSVLLGNGDGTFQTPVSYGVRDYPFTMAVGDFNGDGKPDLAVGSIQYVNILLGNGDGTFQADVVIGSGLNYPWAVAVADFNGDGIPDFAAANQRGNNVSVMLGNGNGTFQAAVNSSVGALPYFVAVGDFNGDGKPDLAVANNSSNNVSILLGNGDGTFQPAVNYNVGAGTAFLAVGDFNGDGVSDLAVSSGNSLSILLGNGNGTFQAAVTYSAGSGIASIAVGDFNGDGLSDLAVANSGSNNVSILLGVLNPNPVPSITNLSPASATFGSPAFTLTVNGVNFITGATVNWNGSPRTTTVVNGTQLTTQISSADVAAAGTASVTVTNPASSGGTGGGTSAAATFAINNPTPTLSSISPNNITAGSGQISLALTGANFIAGLSGSGSVVQWNGSNRATTFVSATNLTATITAADLGAAGTASVTVVNPTPGGGASGALTFTINDPVPALAASNPLSPANATAGGAQFTLTVAGSGFVAASVVQWNGSSRTTTFVNATQLTAVISTTDIATAGTAQVTVFNPAPGGGTSGTATFTIASPNPTPAITSLSPASTTAGGSGFTLTVNGSGFVSNASGSGSVVKWNGSNRTTTFVNATQLTASIAAADIAAGTTATVTVFNPTPGGGTSTGSTFTVNNPTPGITGLSPSSAPPGSPDTTLTVNGLNFNPSSVVQWNTVALTTTFVSATQLTALIPAADLTSGTTANVTVFNPTPAGGTSLASTFTVSNPAPAITSIAPSSAAAGRAQFTLTVNGTGFISSSVVQWNGSNRTTVFLSNTTLQASIPATDITTSGTAQVTVLNPTPGGGTSGQSPFTIQTNNPVPAISTLSPSSATVGGAQFTLIVNGSGFVVGSVVNWNAAARTTAFVNSTQLTATIPMTDIAASGTAQVTVFNPTPGGGTSGQSAFTISSGNPVPAVSSLSPASATLGGTQFTLTVNGSSFVMGAAVQWNGSPRTTSFVSATQLTATIPATDITAAGTAQVGVMNPTPGGGTSASTLTFTINNPMPVINGLSPSSVSAGGTQFTLTVNGTSFVTGAAVQWNGASRTTVFVNATQLTATIPATDIVSQGTAQITVANPAPAVAASSAFSLNIVAGNPCRC